jgi:hypothetical protein
MSPELDTILIAALAALGAWVLLKVLFVLASYLALMCFSSSLKRYALAAERAQEIQCDFECFPARAKQLFLPEIERLEQAELKLLLHFRNQAFEDIGAQSYSTVYVTQDGQTAVSVSYVSGPAPLPLLATIFPDCFRHSGEVFAVCCESCSEGGERLYTLRAAMLQMELPRRYQLKTLELSTPLERVLEVHRKRFGPWAQAVLTPVVTYATPEEFLRQQRIQRAELRQLNRTPDDSVDEIELDPP